MTITLIMMIPHVGLTDSSEAHRNIRNMITHRKRLAPVDGWGSPRHSATFMQAVLRKRLAPVHWSALRRHAEYYYYYYFY